MKKFKFTRGLSRSRAPGFSLVELMVGMAVGLIGIVAIMRAYEFNEAYKRSTGGTGQAQSNGAIALYTLEREIRMAGYGFINSAALGCGKINWYYNGAYGNPPSATGTLPSISLVPVVINVDGTKPDSITVTYGNPDTRLIPTKTIGLPASSAEIKVDDNSGFAENDLFIIVQGGACMMYNATKLNTADTDRLQKNPGKDGPFNPPGNGLFPDYVVGADVFNLGQLSTSTYFIDTANDQRDFSVQPVFTIPTGGGVPVYSNVAQPLVNDIVDLKAWYGKDTTATEDGVIDTWDKVMPTDAAGWLRVRAIKVALLARSGNYEKPTVTGATCEATIAGSVNLKYTDPSNGNKVEYNNIPGGLPSCYRFRSFETTIPLRNVIWRM
jgi:type IV pilus assembly protein PilW